jgi:purine nucleosidase
VPDRVETDSEITRGHTAVEFRAAMAATAAHRWAVSADADGVFGLIAEKCA